MRKKSWLWTMFLVGIFIVSGVVTATQKAYFRAAAQENRLQYGDRVEGQIGSGDQDQWQFDGSEGDVITIRVEQTSGALIPAITLTAPDETLMLDTEAPGSDSAYVQFATSLQDQGSHTIAISGVNGTAGTYALSLTLNRPSTVSAENGTGVTSYGRTVTGAITDEVFRQFWAFQGGRGDVIDLRMMATSGDLDGYLSLLTPDGQELAASDTGEADQNAALLALELPSGGTYTVVARRAGAGFGERGTTQGEYELSLDLRAPGVNSPAITPIALGLGSEARGRLTSDAPSALFETSAEGVLALSLETTDPQQIVSLAVMTPDRVLIDTISGISPLQASVSLSGPKDVWIEVNVAGLAANAPLDFSLMAYQLHLAQRAAEPVDFGRPVDILNPFNGPESWYFSGRSGESVALAISPFGSVLNASVQVTSPDGTPVIDEVIHNNWQRALILTQDGPYEVSLANIIAAGGYRIEVDRIGINGFSFEQMQFPEERGTLIARSPVTGDLTPGSADLWLLYVDHAQEWRFDLNHPGRLSPLGMTVQQPDGTPLVKSLSSVFSSTGNTQISLPAAGLYRVIVFEPTYNAGSNYTLAAYPAEGGSLTVGTSFKGTLTTFQPSNTWFINLSEDSLLDVRIDTLTASAAPSIHIIDPTGQLAASTQFDEGQGSERLTGMRVERGGGYRVVVTQAGLTQPISYRITVHTTRLSDPDSLVFLADDRPVTEVFAVPASPTTPQPTMVTIASAISPIWSANGDSLSAARPAEPDMLIRGEIQPQTRYQIWSVELSGTQTAIISVAALNGTQRPSLTLVDAQGHILAEALQTESNTNEMLYEYSGSNTYYVIVQFANDAGGRYTLIVNTQNDLDQSLPGMLNGHVMAYGETHIGDIAPLTEGTHYLFYGHAGDVITTSVSTLIGQYTPVLQLLTYADGVLREGTPVTGLQISTLGDVTLPSDGLYVLSVMPAAEQSSVERYALYLNAKLTPAFNEHGGGELRDREISTLSAGSPTDRWLFDARAGERVTIRIDPLTAGAPSPLTLALTDTMGNAFLYKDVQFGQSALVLNQILLPRSGIYQVVVTGGQRIGGDYEISLLRDIRRAQDQEGALRYGETDGKVLTRDNYLDTWTFAGSRGDVVSITARGIRGDPAFLSMQLRAYTGQALGTAAADPDTGTSHLDGIILPFDGHYSVIIGNPDDSFAGETAYEITVQLNDSSARSMGSVMEYGDVREGRVYVDDTSDTWLFEGQQADVVSITLETEEPTVAPSLSLVSTDWQTPITNALPEVFATTQALTERPARLEFQLPQSGTYALYLQNAEGASGRYRLRLDQINGSANQARTLVSGLPQTGQIGDVRPIELWTFEGTQSAAVSLRASPDSRANLAPVIEIFDPAGLMLARAEALPAHEATLNAVVLPMAGSYEVRITRGLGDDGETAGQYTLQLDITPAQVPSMRSIGYNQVEAGTLGNDLVSEWWVFEGHQGQMVRLRAETTSGTLDPVIRLYDSASHLVATSDDLAGSTNTELVYTLPGNDSYRVEVSRYQGILGSSQGNYILVVEPIYQMATSQPSQSIAYGDLVAGSLDSGTPNETWMFFGQAQDVIQAKIQFPLDDAPLTLVLRDPAGNELVAGTRDRGDARIDSFALPAEGFYLLDVRRPADARSVFNPYTLDLMLLTVGSSATGQGGFLTIDQNATGYFGETQRSHVWAFEGQSSTAVNLTISRLDGPLAFDVTLFAPDGTSLYQDSTLKGATHALTSGPIMLQADGIYMLVLTPGIEIVPGTRYRLSVRAWNNRAELVPMLTPEQDGTGTLDALNPSDQWQFTAQAGEIISLRAAITAGDLEPELVIQRPDGMILATGLADFIDESWQISIDQVIVPDSGIYTARIGRYDGTTGQYRLMLRTSHISPQAASARDIAFGQEVKTTIAASSAVYYAVQGVAGDVIGLAASSEAGQVGVMVQTEAGDHLMPAPEIGQGEVYVPAVVLPESGRYLVRVELSESGLLELVVFRRPQTAPQGGTIRALSLNQTLAEGVLSADQINQWNFAGNLGEVLTFTVDTTGDQLRADLALYGPTGYLASAVEQNGSRATVLGPIRLPADGDYRLVVRSWLGTSTGSYSIRMAPAEPGVSGSEGRYLAARNDTGYGGLVSEDAQDIWTFDGEAGEIVSVRVEQTSGNGTLAVSLGNSDESWSASGLASTSFTGVEIREAVLPTTGRYNLMISGRVNAGEAVEYRVGVTRVQSSIAARLRAAHGITFGDEFTGELDNSNAAQGWVFFGQRGETIRSTAQPITTDLEPELTLVDPQGNILYVAQGDNSGASAEIKDFTLMSTGFYGLVVSAVHLPEDGRRAEYSISLERLPVQAMLQGSLAQGSADGLLTSSAPIQSWELVPPYSGTYRIRVQTQVPGAVFSLAVYDLNGMLLASPDSSQAETREVTIYLTGHDRALAVVDGGAALRQGRYTILMEPASVQMDGGTLTPAQPEIGVITDKDFTDSWKVAIEETGQLTIAASPTDGDLVLAISVYDSAGTVIAEQDADSTRTLRLSVSVGSGNYTVIVSRKDGGAGRSSGQYTLAFESSSP